MKILLTADNVKKLKCDILIYFSFQEDIKNIEKKGQVEDDIKNNLENITKLGDFAGKSDELSISYTNNPNQPRYMYIGLGERKKFGLDMIRKASAKACKTAKKLKAKKVAIVFSDFQELFQKHNIAENDMLKAVLEGSLLSQYKYIKSNKPDDEHITELIIVLHDKNNISKFKEIVSETEIICESVLKIRDLVNAPANEIDPITFSEKAKKICKDSNIRFTVLKKKEIEEKKMGGLLAVSQGSEIPPRFVIAEYNLDKVELKTIVLVGKGITFDSGGISLKPSSDMWQMKMDMSGAASVLGILESASKLKLPLRIIGLIPLAENLPSGTAQKPGDIITISNGMTVEVDNTDAEGRLILADALVYALKYKPELIIDLATLTGAVVVALGTITTGMMGNNQEYLDKIKQSGERTFERVWQLPLFDEYDELIKSDFADVKNVGGKWGGAITAGMFLKRFVGENNWVHLDIAGTAMKDKNGEYEQKGGTGVGVRLLIDFLKNFK